MDVGAAAERARETGRDDLDAFLDEDGIREEVTARALSRVRYADQAYLITQPVIVHSRADIASLLRAHRIASNETCEQFDGRAGWSDRYVTKAEHEYRARITIDPPTPERPDGDIALSFMAEVWLETAGVALVLMPAELARSMGAVPAPRKERA